MNTADILESALLISAGILAWIYGNGHKDKIAPRLGYNKYRLLCVIAILGGVLVAIGAFVSAKSK